MHFHENVLESFKEILDVPQTVFVTMPLRFFMLNFEAQLSKTKLPSLDLLK